MTVCPEIQVLDECSRSIKKETSLSLYESLLGKKDFAMEGFISSTLEALGELIKRAIEAIKRFWFVRIRNDPNELVRNVILEIPMRRAFADTDRLLKGIRAVDYDSDEFVKTAQDINDVWVNAQDEIKTLLMKNMDDRHYKKLQPDTQIKNMIAELDRFGKACNTKADANPNRQKAATLLINANAVAMQCRRMTIMKYRNEYATMNVSNVTATYL